MKYFQHIVHSYREYVISILPAGGSLTIKSIDGKREKMIASIVHSSYFLTHQNINFLLTAKFSYFPGIGRTSFSWNLESSV